MHWLPTMRPLMWALSSKTVDIRTLFRNLHLWIRWRWQESCYRDCSRFKLDTVAKALDISLENHHRAVDDAAATAEIFVKFVKMLKDRGIHTLKELNQYGSTNKDAIKKLPTYHAIILAQNTVGRYNLYQLVSMSHLEYFARRPRIPKSEFNKLREGLIIGSACEAGELYRAILDNQPPETIARLAEFYDYL